MVYPPSYMGVSESSFQSQIVPAISIAYELSVYGYVYAFEDDIRHGHQSRDIFTEDREVDVYN